MYLLRGCRKLGLYQENEIVGFFEGQMVNVLISRRAKTSVSRTEPEALMQDYCWKVAQIKSELATSLPTCCNQRDSGSAALGTLVHVDCYTTFSPKVSIQISTKTISK